MQASVRALNVAILRRLRVHTGGLPVPCALYGRSRKGFADQAQTSGSYLDKANVTERILNVVKNFQKVDPSKVMESANFQKDLGLDSLDTVEVVMAFEEEFSIEIPDREADKITTCADAIAYIASQPNAK